jgi:hypothetical protein
VFSYSDTIYVHLASGQLIERIRLPTRDFTHATSGGVSDLVSLGPWRRAISEVFAVHWLRNGTFVVELDAAQPPPLPRQRTFLIVARNGDGLAEVRDVDTNLRGVDTRGVLYFSDPNIQSREV